MMNLYACAFAIVAIASVASAADEDVDSMGIAAPVPKKCSNYSGRWGAAPGSPYTVVRQTGCVTLELTMYVQWGPKPQIYKQDRIQMNDQWTCKPGNDRELKCVKGRWRTAKDILITEAIYLFEDRCVYVTETYNEEAEILRSDTSSSCPNGGGATPSAMGRMTRDRRP